MPDEPPFFQQERDSSCVTACLRMVLASYGISKSEDDIIYENQFVDGATPSDLVRAAMDLGFFRTVKASPTSHELQSWISQGFHPIVWVRRSIGLIHTVVVLEIQAEDVRVHDPAGRVGDSRIPQIMFEEERRAARGWAVIIRR